MTEALHIGVRPPYTYDRIEHAMNRLMDYGMEMTLIKETK